LAGSDSLARRLIATIGRLLQVAPPIAFIFLLLEYRSSCSIFCGNNGICSFDKAGPGFIFALAWIIMSSRTAFEQVDRGLFERWRTLGHGNPSVLVRVAIPLSGRRLIAGFMLAWTRALVELAACMMAARVAMPAVTGRGLAAGVAVVASLLTLAAVSIDRRRWNKGGDA
jgi:ABC-type proline/glycine betaine transport system permease subunit